MEGLIPIFARARRQLLSPSYEDNPYSSTANRVLNVVPTMENCRNHAWTFSSFVFTHLKLFAESLQPSFIIHFLSIYHQKVRSCCILEIRTCVMDQTLQFDLTTQLDPSSSKSVVLNGFHEKHDPEPSLEDLERELPVVYDGQIPLGDLISRVVQAIYAELLEHSET